MVEIKIAHLYYDLMNLYGENGNVLVLKKYLEKQGVKVTVKNLTIDEEIDFEEYDIFYIGSGNTFSFKLTLNDILKYREDIKNAIKNKKFFVVTGNALNLFGKYFLNLDGSEIKCLDLLDFDSEEIDFRIIGEQFYQNKNLKQEIIGFQNRDTIIKNVNENNLFTVINGTGSYPKCPKEGVYKNNFYGTFMLGPLLARNPYFTEYLVQKILKEKNIEYKKVKDVFEKMAYNEYINIIKK